MGIPTVPLTELYSAAGEYIRDARRRDSAARGRGVVSRREDGVVSVVTNGAEQKFDYLVMAVPFDVLGGCCRMVQPTNRQRLR